MSVAASYIIYPLLRLSHNVHKDMIGHHAYCRDYGTLRQNVK